MATDSDGEETDPPSPDEAFGALGNETRMEILQALGDADGALSFSELRSRVGVRDSGQFNYHLDKLVGHFVVRTEDGYELRRAGERIVEAVLAGTVTAAPVVEPTEIDQSCPYCGGTTGVRYDEEQLRVFCTECAGAYGEEADERGHLGTLFIPPAGVEGRTASELYRAAHTWGGLATMAAAAGVCPRCSATIDESIRVCTDHRADGGVCDSCGGRYAVGVRFRCTNCIYDRTGMFGVKFLANAELLAFLARNGINPVTPSFLSSIGRAADYDEAVLSVDPFEARFTFTVDDDSLTLTADGDHRVDVVPEEERR